VTFWRSDLLLTHLVSLLTAQNVEAYLVGGSVRDILLGWPLHDYDFAVRGDALVLTRHIADELGGAYVPLDVARNVGRVVLRLGQANALLPSSLLNIDLAGLRGPDIQADLLDRDFTVNAMAIDVQRLGEDPPPVIDPSGGLADLEARVVRAVSEASLRSDPCRLVRAIRVAAQIGGQIESQTRAWLRHNAALLSQTSPERVRDELVRILSLPESADQLQLLDEFGLLEQVFPEVGPMRGVIQSSPHVYDVFDHTLLTVAEAESIADAVFAEDSGFLGPVADYAGPLAQHLQDTPIADRPRWALLELSALFHDIGKPATYSVEPDGRVRFIGHQEVGVLLANQALRRLKFGTREIQIVEAAVRHHMRPLLLGSAPQVSRRAVYRFFRDTGASGLDILLLSLADFRATRGPTLTAEAWQRRLEVVKLFLDRYFQQRAEVVAPPKLIDGHDLTDVFALEPGPQYAVLLEAVREAQAEGLVANRAEALNLVEGLLSDPAALEAVAASQVAELAEQTD
jgi:putative nucleotidyltransferase with HDIG domain